MAGIASIGVHLPRLRLSRSAIAEAVGWLVQSAGAGKGTRTLGFWDEDSVTMAVAAARDALDGGDREPVAALRFATTTQPFAEPQGAAIIHAALRLSARCRTQDSGGTARAGLIAVHDALEAGTSSLVVAADRPVALAGSLAESRSGDGAAAVLVGEGAGLFRYLGGADVAAPFVDRYRAPDRVASQDWEERWVREEGYLGLVPRAVEAALAAAGVDAGAIDVFAMPCAIPGCAAAVARAAGLADAALAPSLMDACGDTGSGHAILMLAAAAETMSAGQRIVVAQFGQGATAIVLEAGPNIGAGRQRVARQLAAGIPEHAYTKLLAFSGLLPWERGLRGRVPVNEALTTAYRNADALLGFVGGRCRETGRVQFPASRITAGDGFHLDTQDPWPLADLGGRVATATADLLAFSRHPPNCYGLVDINGGGRLMMDFTDPDAAELATGDPVRFEFRVKDIDERTGYRRYFWKAASARAAAG